MMNIAWVNKRYRIAAEMLQSTIEIWAVGHAQGWSFNLALKNLLASITDSPGAFGDVIGAAKVLRWRLLTEPQPRGCGGNNPVLSAAHEVVNQINKVRMTVGPVTLAAMDSLARAVELLAQEEPPVCPTLLEAIDEVGAGNNCVVVAANAASAECLAKWLHAEGTGVLTAGELIHYPHEIEQVYVVGPPRFFPPAITTAPVTSRMAFVIPEWFKDRTLPTSPLSPYAQGTFTVPTKVFPVKAAPAASTVDECQLSEDDLLPQPRWPVQGEPNRHPHAEEVLARRVLLSGGYCIFLDDGERIRTIDPTQTPEDRLVSLPFNAVKVGTYLLSRKGESEQGTLYREALATFGPAAQMIIDSQNSWKAALNEKIDSLGIGSVAAELDAIGVKAAGRAGSWADPTLDRPQRGEDFQSLLQWLGISEQPTFGLATKLRRKRQQLGHAMRLELEQALSASDLSALIKEGHLDIPATTPQYRGMVTARVLAISPWREIIPRQRVRVLFEDRDGGGRWLE